MIPDFQELMLPLLKLLSDKKEHNFLDLINILSNQYNLTEEEKNAKTSTGFTIIDNRVGWAKTYLKKAKLLEYTKRGYSQITERGLDVLSKNPSKIDVKFLEQFNEFIEFRSIKNTDQSLSTTNTTINDSSCQNKTPIELMEDGYNSITANLKQELLDKLREYPPAFFEKTILKLLEKMGYGKGEVTGKSGDGGVDGIIYQDKLKLEKIYLQAKRFAENNPVTAHMVRDFVGALEVNGVNKGVFITTSKFPRDSLSNIKSQKSIKLIDGYELADLMIEHNLGVSIENTFKIKKIDLDFFEEE